MYVLTCSPLKTSTAYILCLPLGSGARGTTRIAFFRIERWTLDKKMHIRVNMPSKRLLIALAVVVATMVVVAVVALVLTKKQPDRCKDVDGECTNDGECCHDLVCSDQKCRYGPTVYREKGKGGGGV